VITGVIHGPPRVVRERARFGEGWGDVRGEIQANARLNIWREQSRILTA
jgi:hypothetical protein